MPKPIRLLFFLFLSTIFVNGARCAETAVSVKILQVGYQGVLTNNSVSLVQVEVRNSGAQPITFELRVKEANLDARAQPITGTYTLPYTLGAGETQTANIAMHVIIAEHSVIFAEAVDSTGHTIARAARSTGTKTDGQVIALLCATPEICKTIQQEILFTGSPEEQARKSRNLRLIQPAEGAPMSWAWSAVTMAVMAEPASRFTLAEREAFEGYLHRGGRVVLVQDQLQDGVLKTSDKTSAEQLLGVYRRQVPFGKPFVVGAGQFIQFPSVNNKEFVDFFRPLGTGDGASDELEALTIRFQHVLRGNDTYAQASWLMTRLGTTFHFPGFYELLCWIIGYLLLVGVVNFISLRRMGRQEWGWITIPVIAVLFSILLYAVSARNHPKNFGLDEMTVYRMDNLSSLAMSESKIRVSSPVRATVHAILPGDLVQFVQQQNGIDFFPAANGVNRREPRNIRIGKHWEADMFLRRWSYHDLFMQGQKRFAGTVYRDAVGQLHNETGLNYQQAIMVDQDDVFLLNNFAAGAVVDLAHVPRETYRENAGWPALQESNYPGPPFAVLNGAEKVPNSEDARHRFELEFQALPKQAFAIKELIRGWPADGENTFSRTKAVFLGFSEEATLDGKLQDHDASRKAYSLTIVTFEEWP